MSTFGLALGIIVTAFSVGLIAGAFIGPIQAKGEVVVSEAYLPRYDDTKERNWIEAANRKD